MVDLVNYVLLCEVLLEVCLQTQHYVTTHMWGHITDCWGHEKLGSQKYC